MILNVNQELNSHLINLYNIMPHGWKKYYLMHTLSVFILIFLFKFNLILSNILQTINVDVMLNVYIL